MLHVSTTIVPVATVYIIMLQVFEVGMPSQPIYSTTDGTTTEGAGGMADNTSYKSPWFEFESSSSRILEIYVALPLLFVAIIGNSLIFVVFSTGHYRHNLTAMLYRILALADGLVVVIRDGLYTLPIVTLGKSAYAHNLFTCKFANFLEMWLRSFSVWIIVILTVEKFVCVLRPYRDKMANTKWNYGWLALGILVVACIMHAPLLITTTRKDIILNNKLIGVCTAFRHGSIDWYRIIFCWMNMFVNSVLPLLFVSVANTAIVHRLKSTNPDHTTSCSPHHVGESGRHRSNITILLLISTTSVVFTLLHPLYLLLRAYIRDTKSDAFHGLITFRYVLPLFDALNRSINILLFCIFGRNFRQHLKELLLCKRIRNDWSCLDVYNWLQRDSIGKLHGML